MSYERMEKRAAELEAEVAKWLAAAEGADAAEDKQHGANRTGEEMPDWIADKKKRAETIRRAKAELEAEAKAAADTKSKAEAAAEQQRRKDGGKKPDKPAALPSSEPAPKAQKNFTDPESRIMKTKDGFIQGYNGQAAVDSTAQVIVAQDLDARPTDQHQLVPMIEAIRANLGRDPTELSADSGFCSEANLTALEARGIDAYIATGRAKHAVADTTGDESVTGTVAAAALPSPEQAVPPTRVAAMRKKIADGGHESPYRLRKQLPEPVFGQIKQARGFRQFLLRGVEKVRAEWAVICTAHNILKLATGLKRAKAA
jgi:hypothetical protein